MRVPVQLSSTDSDWWVQHESRHHRFSTSQRKKKWTEKFRLKAIFGGHKHDMAD